MPDYGRFVYRFREFQDGSRMKNIKTVSRPDNSTVLKAQQRETQLSINCVKIGTIIEFDPNTQLASVQIAYKQVVSVDEAGNETLRDYPLLLECPVVVLFGGVDIISLPIQKGDSCLVLFNDRDIDYWLNHGDGGVPTTARLHDISDGVALVGIRPLTNSITNYLANGIRLSHGQGNSQIDLKENLIESIATLFLHNGNMEVTGNHLVKGNFTVEGTTYGNGGTWTIDSDIQQVSGRSIHAGNGATGTFHVVTVVDGIVTGGSNP